MLGAALTCAATVANAQATWNAIGPSGGTVLSVTASPLMPSIVYVGTAQNGVFMSTDSGQTWSAVNVGLAMTTNSANRTVRALVSDGQYLYAATDAGLYFAAVGATTTDVPSWTALASPSGIPGAISLLAVDARSRSLFAASPVVDAQAAPSVYAMPLPAAGGAPVATWTASPMPPATVGTAVGAIAVMPESGGSAVVVGVADRLLKGSVASANAALQWLDEDAQGQLRATGAVEAIHYSGDYGQLYVCSGGQMMSATNPLDPTQNTWLALTITPAPATAFSCTGLLSGGLAYGLSSVIVLTTSAGVYLSNDGVSFVAAKPMAVDAPAYASAIGGASPNLFVGAAFGVSTQPWSTLAPAGDWTPRNGPTSVAAGGANARLNNASVTDSAAIGSTLYAAVASAPYYADVLTSTDAGATWTSTGLRAALPDLVDIPAVATDPTNRVVYAGTSIGLFALAGGSWLPVAPATITEVWALSVVGGTLFVGTDSGLRAIALSATPSNAVATDAGLAGLRVSALHVAAGHIYAGVLDLNSGTASVSVAATGAVTPTWNSFASTPVGTHRIVALLWDGSALLAASRGEMVSLATPGGAWGRVVNGLSDPNAATTALASDGTSVYVATGSNGVFAAPLAAGYTWTAFNGSAGTDLPSLEVHALRFDGQTVYAATAGGLATLGVTPSSPPPTTPPPSTAGSSSGGGGALDAGSLWGLLLVVALLWLPRTRARHR